MKASIKFREKQKPLTRAKIPLSILGFPFQSGVVSGSPKELALSLATSFESGPSIKIAYRPNDGLNPFSLIFKTGIGPMTMSTEFSLIGSQKSPRFFVHFKPRFGDFSVKKSQSSDFVAKGSDVEDESIEKLALGFLRGTEGNARTSLPVTRQAVLSFRWGFRLPAERGPVGKMPLLVMNKVSIEHVAEGKKGNNSGDGDDVADTWQSVRRQMEMVEGENVRLRKGIEELRCELAAGGGGEKKMKEERDVKEDLNKGE